MLPNTYMFYLGLESFLKEQYNYRGSPPYTHLGTWKKSCYMKFLLVGLYCGPLLTLIPPLTCTYAKNYGSGNRVSDFHVSGGPPVRYPFLAE